MFGVVLPHLKRLTALPATTNCRGGRHIFGSSGVPNHPTVSQDIHDCRSREALGRTLCARYGSDEYEEIVPDRASAPGRSWFHAPDGNGRDCAARRSPRRQRSIRCPPHAQPESANRLSPEIATHIFPTFPPAGA